MINGIINAIIFYFLEKGHIGTKTFAVGDIVKDLAFTSLILGWILASIVLPLTLKDVKKGKIKTLPIENLSMTRQMNIAYNKDFANTDVLNDIVTLYRTSQNK